MAAKFREIWIINVYAPSGTAMKQERERFFNSELLYLLTGETGHILLGGNFNRILDASDTTGGFTYSRALAELVHGLALTDTWQGNPTRKVYTHYSVSGGTRIDRIYATRELLERKLGVEVTAAWLKTWNLTGTQASPPLATKFPTKLAYLHVYAVNTDYITPPEQDEAPRCFRRRIYASLHSMALALKGARDVRIMTQHPTTPWSKVWRNLHAVWSSEELGAAWFMIIHDLTPTNDRLAKIQRSTTNNCQQCGRVDTLIHRLTECSEGADIWWWARSRIAVTLRMAPKYILPEWTVRPIFHFLPLQRHRAILWILAHTIYYRTQHWPRVSTVDCADFMRRARWKAYQTTRRREKVGNYFEIL